MGWLENLIIFENQTTRRCGYHRTARREILLFFGKFFTGKEDKNDRETCRGNAAKD